MGKPISLLILFFFWVIDANSQSISVEYSVNIEKADSFFRNKAYQQAGIFYNKAFSNVQGFSDDYHRLFAAISWAKAGNNDSSFVQLYYLVYGMCFEDCKLLEQSFVSTSLVNTSEFAILVNRCRCQETHKNTTANPSLTALLDSVYRVDQAGRSLPNIIHSQNEQSLSKEMEQAKNLRLVDSLYALYGWLSYHEVGRNGAMAQFLVVQHANLQQQKDRLPRINKAVEDCLLIPEASALLSDRINVLSGRKQLYGTQLKFDTSTHAYVPYPIKNRKKVDKRRIKMGMATLQSYLAITL